MAALKIRKIEQVAACLERRMPIGASKALPNRSLLPNEILELL